MFKVLVVQVALKNVLIFFIVIDNWIVFCTKYVRTVLPTGITGWYVGNRLNTYIGSEKIFGVACVMGPELLCFLSQGATRSSKYLLHLRALKLPTLNAVLSVSHCSRTFIELWQKLWQLLFEQTGLPKTIFDLWLLKTYVLVFLKKV